MSFAFSGCWHERQGVTLKVHVCFVISQSPCLEMDDPRFPILLPLILVQVFHPSTCGFDFDSLRFVLAKHYLRLGRYSLHRKTDYSAR